MIEWTRRKTWIAGFAILAVTNAVALGGAAYNRAGEPNSTLVLTERELTLPRSGGFTRENSGISLKLEWRTLPTVFDGHAYRGAAVEWLNESKLEELGFSTRGVTATPESRSRFNHGLSRESWLVLEYAGPAYHSMRERVSAFAQKEQELASRNPGNEEFEKRAAQAAKLWDRERQAASRLFVIDAGMDAAALGKQYPDKDRYIIARGQVRAAVRKTADSEWRVQGHIQGLAVRNINVPFELREVFKPWSGERSRSQEDPPRYRVTIAYGRRYEPWVVSAEAAKH